MTGLTVCSNCQFRNASEAKFCSECGHILVSADLFAADELRILTVLFADIQGFTGLSARLSPDLVKELLEASFPMLTACVKEEGGMVVKYEGDSLMAIFGKDESSFYAATSACYAAIKMHKSFYRFRQTLKEPGCIDLRIGLHSGQVILTTIGGRPDILGDTVNVAKRMEQNAPSGQTLISSDVMIQVQNRFLLTHRGTILVKGREKPVRTFLLTGKSGVHKRRILEREGSLIGRETEIEFLFQALEKVKKEHKPVLCHFEAEPGMGKSRLLQDFINFEREREGFTYVFSCFFNSAVASSYRILKVLSFLLKTGTQAELIKQFACDEVTLEKEKLTQLSAAFCRLAGLPHQDSGWLEELSSRPEALMLMAFRCIGYWLEKVSEKILIVFLIDDIHAADEGSLNFLDYVIRKLKGQILILCSGRPYPLTGGFSFSGSNYCRCQLPSLSEQDCQEMAGGLLSHVEAVPENLVSDIVRFANGIPFFVEEYIIHLQSCGIITQQKNGKWFFNSSLYTDGQIPASIELLVQERVDKLSVRHQKILKTASVFGTQFFRQALPDLCGTPEPKELLNDCIEHGLVVKDRQNRTYGFRFYRFSHEIIRRCIYNRLTGRQKKELHHRLAVWMESNVEISGDDNSFLAVHYLAADDKQKGAQYSFRAAEKSFLNHQPEEAVKWYEKFFFLSVEGIITVQPQEFLQALRNISDLYLMRGLLEKADQLFETLFQSYPENVFMRIQILLCHLKVVFLAQLPEKTGRLLKKTEEQMSMLSSAAAGYWDCLGWLRLRQGEYHRMKADYEKSELCFQEALDLAVTNFEPVLEILALYSLSIVFSICNKQQQVYECCRKGIEISRQHNLIRREAQGYHNLGAYYHLQGNLNESRHNFSRALSICEETGDIAGLMLGYRKLSGVFISGKDHEKAREYLLKALEYATIIRSEKEIHRINLELAALK